MSGSAWASIWLPALLDGRQGPSCGSRRSATRASCSGCSWSSGPADADSFTDEDDRVLTELARQAGLAFHNVRLDAALQTTLDELRRQADELRESRARIVASADAERRRVERDLHDGAQQHLVALAVNLRLARDIIADDPEAGAEMLDQMVGDVQVTIQELRELAHGIYPPLLADGGLGEALRAAASRAALPVTRHRRRHRPVLPGGRDRRLLLLPGGAAERGQARRRGRPREVRLWEESGGLLFSVSDDGPGFDAARARRGPRLRQHVRPARRHGRDASAGNHGPGTAPPITGSVSRSLRAARAGRMRRPCVRRGQATASPSPVPPTAGAACPRRTAPC